MGIDIGGTKVAAGVVDEDGRVVEQVRRDTPSTSPTATEETIVEIVAELSSRHDISAVGIGAAGFIDADRSIVRFSPHLAWREEPLRDVVGGRTGLPVVIENDANAGAWAEYRFGAGRGAPVLACVNLGTGIGGGVVVGGVLQRGGYGMAAEFGHMTVVPDGRRCECGNRGCWEQYVSGNALAREAREMAASNSPVAQGLLALVGGHVGAITGPVVTQAAQAGDPAAMSCSATWAAHWASASPRWPPSSTRPGSSSAGASRRRASCFGPAREVFARSLTGRGYRPEAPVLAAELGNNAGFIGAADTARAS